MSLEEFVLKNQGLLVGIASRYAKKVVDFGIEFDDLYQVGALELVERYKDYCSEKGSVSVFSYWVIRTAILNYIRDHRGITHFSASLSHLSSALSKKNSSFYQETGRYMTEEEMIFYIKQFKSAKNFANIKELVKTLQQIDLYHLSSNKLSLNDMDFSNAIETDQYNEALEFEQLVEHIVSNVDVEEEAISNIWIEEILSTIQNEKREKYDIFVETLGLADGIPKTRGHLAEKYHCSCNNIEQKYKSTLRKVKQNAIKKGYHLS